MGGAPSRSRRLAREAAYQALYMVQVGRAGMNYALDTVRERQGFTGDAETFLQHTVEGVMEQRRFLDDVIEPCLSEKWSLSRIAVSDLTALRIAAFELYFRPGVPPKVSITEAVELAKRYGTKDSGAFVNGVLGTVLKGSPKADWDPSMEEFPEDEEPEATMPDEPDSEEEDEEDVVDEAAGQVGSWTLRSED